MARITLHDVARHAGVSPSTVSCALRNDANVTPATRARIQAVAMEMGYQPDPVLSALGARRFKRKQEGAGAGLVYLYRMEAGVRFTQFSYERELTLAGSSEGYHVQLEDFDTITSFPSRLRKWYNTGVRGVVIAKQMRLPEFPPELWNPFCVVTIGGGESNLFHNVHDDVQYNLQECFSQAHQLGYKKIGVALEAHPTPIADDITRLGVARCLLEAHGSDIPFFCRPFRQNDGFLDWYHKYRPELVIGFTAGRYLWLLEEAGIQVGKEVAFCAAGNVEAIVDRAKGLSKDEVSGVCENAALMARMCVQKLEALYRLGEQGVSLQPTRTVIPGIWRAGNTMPSAEVIRQFRNIPKGFQCPGRA
ncbi:MAG: LacI family DNA-binding transcriptional regulator [Verrucomicrobiota bacterium]|nr:LacI family DNA-binding transcriptional regulator [Verrucomicrobiota bacterium]